MMRTSNDERLYGDRALCYDAIYSGKDYAGEAVRVRTLLREEGMADGARVLEAACGTGSYMLHLRSWFDIDGFDLSMPMLAIAREKLGPRAHLFHADMTDFAVEKPYDAMLCLFSSIGHLPDEAALSRAAQCFARAIRPGGALIVEPWVNPDDFRSGYADLMTGRDRNLKVARAGASRREGDMAVLRFHWAVAETSAGRVETFSETFRMWLCPRDLMQQTFERAGFDVRFEADGLVPWRGLFVGRRRH